MQLKLSLHSFLMSNNSQGFKNIQLCFIFGEQHYHAVIFNLAFTLLKGIKVKDEISSKELQMLV